MNQEPERVLPKKTIVEFQVLDHGVNHEQYFQGCGICLTNFTDVATGHGSNYAEAVDDALESLAQNDWDTEHMEKRILAQEFSTGKRKLPTTPKVLLRDGYEAHYYVSIRVK